MLIKSRSSKLMGMLEIKNLSIDFGGIRALNGIDLAVRDNEILSIIGPNGSGKTTLFNCLTGIYHPDGGDIVYQGESLLGLSPDLIAIRGIARTFQNLRLFMNMNVLDNLMLGRHVHMKKNIFAAFLRLRGEELRHRERVEEIIDFLDLQAYRKSRVADCPYGVQKRIELGRARPEDRLPPGRFDDGLQLRPEDRRGNAGGGPAQSRSYPGLLRRRMTAS